MNKFTIWYRSVPGMYEQYVTKAVVYADDQQTAIDKGFNVIKKDFPERNRGMWKVDKIEVNYDD